MAFYRITFEDTSDILAPRESIRVRADSRNEALDVFWGDKVWNLYGGDITENEARRLKVVSASKIKKAA